MKDRSQAEKQIIFLAYASALVINKFRGTWNPVHNGEVWEVHACEEGRENSVSYWCESLMFFPGPLAVLIKMLMDLYCVCIYFDNHNAGGKKSIKLKCCFCRREEHLLSFSTRDRSRLPAKHWLQILNSRYCTHGMTLVGEELRVCNFPLILQSLDIT